MTEIDQQRLQRNEPGRIVYFLTRQSEGDDLAIQKGSIVARREDDGGSDLEVGVSVGTDPESSYSLKRPFVLFTEEEVLRTIAHNGGLARIDSDRTVDELVTHKMAGKEIVPMLVSKIIERQEY